MATRSKPQHVPASELEDIVARYNRLRAENDAQRMAAFQQAEATYTAAENAGSSPVNAVKYREALALADWRHRQEKDRIQAEHCEFAAAARRTAP